MWPYVLLIILPIAIQHLKIKNGILRVLSTSDDRSRLAMKVFWTILLVLLVLRDESIGRDLETYEVIYRYIDRSSWPTALGRSAEVAWSIINKMISELGGNFRMVIVVASLMAVMGIANVYIKNSDDAVLTIILFANTSCFILLFSGLRQCVAISLGMFAYLFVREKRLVPFLVISFIAILFHTSSFMLLFMYPLYHAKLTRKSLIYIIPALLIVYIFNQQIFTVLGYILVSFSDYDMTISETGSYTMIVLLIIFALFSYIIPDEDNLDADTVGLRNFLLLALVLQMFAPLHTLAMRMNYYYLIFMPLLIPKVIRQRSVRMKQIAILSRYVMIVFFVFYFFTTAPSDNVLHTFPYSFLWEGN